MLNPSLLRLFRMNDKNLCVCCLAHPVFSDMMFVSTVSRRSNRCTQVYATDFGWVKTLPLLFTRNGVPPACICNNAKETIQGKFYQKHKDTAYHLKQLEPYTPWSNTAERGIKELKKGANHKLLQSRAPKHLCNDCLELRFTK